MRRLVQGVLVTDLVVLAAATATAMVVKFGLETPERTWGPFELSYPLFGLMIAVVWWSFLSVFDTRRSTVLGEGLEEFRLIGTATAATFGAVSVFSVLVKLDFSRGYIAVAMPLGLLGLLLSRWMWRQQMRRWARAGAFRVPVMVIGGPESVRKVRQNLEQGAGRHHVACSWDPSSEGALVGGDATSDSTQRFAARVRDNDVSIVIVTESHVLGAEGLRALGWLLADVRVLVSPQLAGVSLERLRMTYVDGTPMVSIEAPQYARAGGLLKTCFDKLIAGALVVVFAPLLAVIAVLVRCTSPGPVLFGHQRVGKDGEPFTMWKFRSMRAGAEAELAGLLADAGTADQPLFKIEQDPRITRVGRVIRRYSLDELPQLFNVLGGTMSLVGPRPQISEEVALYSGSESLRLRVRPGMTGLWQVSGRSTMSWQEACRLDLYYVENWSMIGDLVILCRTIRAVAGGVGAH